MRGDPPEVGLIDPQDRVARELEEILADPEAVAVHEAFAAEEAAVEFSAGAALVDEEKIAALTFDDGVDLGNGRVLRVEFEAEDVARVGAFAATEHERGAFQRKLLHRPAAEDGRLGFAVELERGPGQFDHVEVVERR